MTKTCVCITNVFWWRYFRSIMTQRRVVIWCSCYVLLVVLGCRIQSRLWTKMHGTKTCPGAASVFVYEILLLSTLLIGAVMSFQAQKIFKWYIQCICGSIFQPIKSVGWKFVVFRIQPYRSKNWRTLDAVAKSTTMKSRWYLHVSNAKQAWFGQIFFYIHILQVYL